MMGKLGFFMVWLSCFGLGSLRAQVFRMTDLTTYQSKARSEAFLKTERAIAKRFHDLMNAYRVEKKLAALEWNEACFLAAHNHNQWMAQRETLSHEQNAKNAVFTGLNPGDRLKYVLQGSTISLSWSAENCLQSFVEDMASISIDKVAAEALEQWRASPGHNANILGKGHASCGTAFRIVDGWVWATTLFAYPTN